MIKTDALNPQGIGSLFFRVFSFSYKAPTQLVVPSAVTIAVAILAIICTMNFNVSFLVIAHLLS